MWLWKKRKREEDEEENTTAQGLLQQQAVKHEINADREEILEGAREETTRQSTQECLTAEGDEEEDDEEEEEEEGLYVMAREYVRVARLSELQEDKGIRFKWAKASNTEMEALAIFLHKGQVYAIQDRCPHAGGPLSKGTIEDIEDLDGGHCSSSSNSNSKRRRSGEEDEEDEEEEDGHQSVTPVKFNRPPLNGRSFSSSTSSSPSTTTTNNHQHQHHHDDGPSIITRGYRSPLLACEDEPMVVCPWHAFRFGLRTGRCTKVLYGAARAAVYPCKVERNSSTGEEEVFVEVPIKRKVNF